MFSSIPEDASMGTEMSNTIHKNVKKEEEDISLVEDFVCAEPCNENVYLNEEKEVERKLFPAKQIQKNEIKNNIQQHINLKDDFALPNEDSPSTSRNMSSNQATGSSQPLFVESSLTTNEIKNIEKQKIALEDDFVRSEDFSSLKRCNSPNTKEKKTTLKEDFSSVEDSSNLNKDNALGRQILNTGHLGKVDDVSSSTVDVNRPNTGNGLQFPNQAQEMQQADEDMINDPDYQLNTMSDIR